MVTEISSGQVFCLRNWAGCINSLSVKVTASYKDGQQKSAQLDLPGNKGELEGLIIVIMAQPGSSGILFVGSDMGSTVTQFTLELENTGAPVRSLGLECAAANAAEIFANSASVSYFPLLCSGLRFTAGLSGFSVETYSPAGSVQENSPAENAPEAEITSDDILGDIEADIAMLSYYQSGSGARQAIDELNALKEQVYAMPPEIVSQELARYESLLPDCIQRTRSDIRLYRDSLIEDSMKK